MDEILNIIRSEITLAVQQEIKKYMKENKYEKLYQGIVNCEENVTIPVNATNVLVEIPAFDGKKISLKNKTGESLVKDDCVIVYAIGGNINNAYIGLKF